MGGLIIMNDSQGASESNCIDCGEYIDIANIGQLSEKLRNALDSSDLSIVLNGVV